MKRLLPIISIICIIGSCIVPFNALADEKEAEEEKEEKYSLHSEYMLVCDNEAHFEIYSKGSEKEINPYSFTKILTAICVIENTKDLDKLIKVPEKILADYDYKHGNIGLASGEEMSARNMIEAILMQDAGDCALALAHTTVGSYSDFIRLMNDTAKKAGAVKSVFTEPAGFADSKQKTTLSDMAKITAYALRNEFFAKTVQKSYFEIPPNNMRQRARRFFSKNKFLSRFYSEDYYDERMCGVKEYYIDENDTGLIARYKSGGDDLLILCAGADAEDDKNYAYDDVLELKDKGHDYFTRKTHVKKEEFVSEINLKTSKDTDRALIISLSEINTKIPKDYKSELLTREIKLRDNIDAPLEKYEELGEINIYYDGILIGSAPVASYHKIEKSNVKLIKNALVDMILSVYFWIIAVIVVAIIYVIKQKRKRKRA